MKSSIDILRCVLVDTGHSCDVSTTQDLKTILGRVEDEGDSFLTITLPSFAKGLERALDEGKVSINTFPGFKRSRRSGGLPVFLQGFLCLIFDAETCVLKEYPSVEAIFAVRQICLLFSKVLSPCTTERENDAYRQYIRTEAEVRLADSALDGSHRRAEFVAMCRVLWDRYFGVCERKLGLQGAIFKHGPGATADYVLGNAKYRNQRWTERLDKEFPHWETGTLVPNERFLDRLSVTLQPPGAETPARVVSVPKTLKTPRIIALEPAHMQYVQQGIARILREEARRDDFASNFVRSDSQTHNRVLARQGSSDGTLATLDLSEASDRVSNQHVRLLFGDHPHLFRAVDASRSRTADVPGYGVQRLAKFASMGSALTFPVEALVFTTIVFLGIQRAVGHRLTTKDIKFFRGQVRVYGDDIIVPVHYVDHVIRELQSFGLVVNTNKSFWTGKFRESCGAEFYDGHDVSVVRQRRILPESRANAKELVSTVEFRNLLYWRGLWTAARALDDVIRKLIPYPVVTRSFTLKQTDWSDSEVELHNTSVLVGRESVFNYQAEYTHPHHHSPLVRGVAYVAKPPSEELDDYAALMKWFASRGEMPTEPNTLSSSGRPRTARLVTRKGQPF